MDIPLTMGTGMAMVRVMENVCSNYKAHGSNPYSKCRNCGHLYSDHKPPAKPKQTESEGTAMANVRYSVIFYDGETACRGFYALATAKAFRDSTRRKGKPCNIVNLRTGRIV